MTNDKLLIFHMDMNFTCLKPKYIRNWLKKLAQMGYNAILWEIEDKIKWEICPECVSPEAMTKKTFKGLLEYSRKLGLEPIPLLQTIGHGEYIMKHEKYHSFREKADRSDCYCPCNPEVRIFLKRFVSEYLELFGNIRFFHLGADEAWGFGSCEKCKKAIAESSANILYSEHIVEIAEEIIEKGIRPGIWCDMLMHYPEEHDKIPPEFIIWDWNYWDSYKVMETIQIWGMNHHEFTKAEIREQKLDEKVPELFNEKGELNNFYVTDFLIRNGYEVIVCSTSRCYFDSFACPQLTRHAENVLGAAQKVNHTRALGHCVTSWAIRQHPFELQEPIVKMAAKAMECSATPEDILAIEAPLAMELDKIGGGGDNSFYRKLSGIEWSGLKDSLPAPEGHIKKTLSKLEGEDKDFFDNHEENLNKLRQMAQEGEKSLKQSSDPSKTEWLKAADFQLRFYQAMSNLFIKNNNQEAVKQLKDLKIDIEDYYCQSQTPQSAAKNASLIFDTYIEYGN